LSLYYYLLHSVLENRTENFTNVIFFVLSVDDDAYCSYFDTARVVQGGCGSPPFVFIFDPITHAHDVQLTIIHTPPSGGGGGLILRVYYLLPHSFAATARSSPGPFYLIPGQNRHRPGTPSNNNNFHSNVYYYIRI